MAENAELNVEDMNCDNCREKVEKSLTEIDGVNSVTIDLKAEKVTVSYDENKIRLVDIKQTLMEKGYSVMEI